MAFCFNCGNPLVNGAKFCTQCGTPQAITTQPEQRKTVYDGEIHKCPNCGEIVDALLPKCPTCGYEFRGVKSVSSAQVLSAKLAELDAQRKPKDKKKSSNNDRGELNEIDEQKITLISTFPIPNAKEDLFEFVVVACSNVNTDLYKDERPKREFAITKAWNATLEQAYIKSKVLFAGDFRLDAIEAMHKEIQHKIEDAKIKKAKEEKSDLLVVIFFALGIISILTALIAWGVSAYYKREEKTEAAQIEANEQREVARLEAIVADVENALDIGDYKLALMYAETIAFRADDNNETQIRKWDAQRKYLIEKITDEAAANGVDLNGNSNSESKSSLVTSDSG